MSFKNFEILEVSHLNLIYTLLSCDFSRVCIDFLQADSCDMYTGYSNFPYFSQGGRISLIFKLVGPSASIFRFVWIRFSRIDYDDVESRDASIGKRLIFTRQRQTPSAQYRSYFLPTQRFLKPTARCVFFFYQERNFPTIPNWLYITDRILPHSGFRVTKETIQTIDHLFVILTSA